MSKLGRSADSAAVGIVLRLEHAKSMRYTLRNLLVKVERAIGHSAKLPQQPATAARRAPARRFLLTPDVFGVRDSPSHTLIPAAAVCPLPDRCTDLKAPALCSLVGAFFDQVGRLSAQVGARDRLHRPGY